MIGIIGAMESEMKHVITQMQEKIEQQIGPFSYTKGTLWGQEVVVAICQEGKVNAAICTQMMVTSYPVAYVLNIGVAGGVENYLPVGALVVATATVTFDQDTTALGYPLGYTFGLEKVVLPCDDSLSQRLWQVVQTLENGYKGIIASSDTFVTKEETKQIVKDSFQALAVDMETASIHQVCQLNHIPFGAIRAISDSGNTMEFREFLVLAVERINQAIQVFFNQEGK